MGRVIPVGRALASPQAHATWRGLLCLNKMATAIWGGLSTGSLVSVPSVLSPEPPTSDSQASLVYSALPVPEPRQVAANEIFAIGPLRGSLFPAISPWQTEPLLPFTAGCYLRSFLALAALSVGWGAQLGV